MIILIFVSAILIVFIGRKKMLGKLFSLFKGKVNSAGEAIIDNNKIDIFKQKIREADDSLDKMTTSKTEIMAHIAKVEREIADINMRIKQNEIIVKTCLYKDKRDLALEVSSKIGDLETELKVYNLNIEKLRKADAMIASKRKEVSDKINSMKQNIIIYESQESVRKALKNTSSIIGNNINLDESSLESISKEIEESQSFEMDKLFASQEIYNKDIKVDLSNKLEKEGILSKNYSAEEILSRYEPIK